MASHKLFCDIYLQPRKPCSCAEIAPPDATYVTRSMPVQSGSSFKEVFAGDVATCMPGMRCRAVGVIYNGVAGGQLTGTCQMPHGHNGECDWAAQKLTDAALLAEYDRRSRGSWSAELTALRGMREELVATITPFAPEATHIASWLKEQLEELKVLRSDANYLRERANDCNRRHMLRDDSDEWQRKFELMEHRYAELLAQVARGEMLKPPPPIVVDMSKIPLTFPGAPELQRVGEADIRFFHDKKGGAFQETGPGIAALDTGPEPLAHLDEDLLADDA